MLLSLNKIAHAAVILAQTETMTGEDISPGRFATLLPCQEEQHEERAILFLQRTP